MPDGATLAIPNDPSNEARALLLLQKAQLITLKPGAGVKATKLDIVGNPKHFKIVELEAAQLPRSLSDVDAAVINTNFAAAAGLSPIRDAIFHEDTDSPYVNLIVVRAKDANDPRVQTISRCVSFRCSEARSEKIIRRRSDPRILNSILSE